MFLSVKYKPYFLDTEIEIFSELAYRQEIGTKQDTQTISQ
jgi:hypothetical protein